MDLNMKKLQKISNILNDKYEYIQYKMNKLNNKAEEYEQLYSSAFLLYQDLNLIKNIINNYSCSWKQITENEYIDLMIDLDENEIYIIYNEPSILYNYMKYDSIKNKTIYLKKLFNLRNNDIYIYYEIWAINKSYIQDLLDDIIIKYC